MSQHKSLDAAAYDGIRKTINHFRERPLFYFTEADLHSSLQRSLLQNNRTHFVAYTSSRFPVSLVHLEYPTNFRFKKSHLINGYKISLSNYQSHKTYLKKEDNYGDRGHYDLVILNREFVEYDHSHLDDDLKEKKAIYNKQKAEAMHIVNKDNQKAIMRLQDKTYNPSKGQNPPTRFQREVCYAIEFKYIHPFNARHKNTLDEIKKDNEKLKLAYYHSHGFIRPINLIFCSSIGLQRRDAKATIVDQIRNYISGKDPEGHCIPDHVLNIFIQSYISVGKKQTDKPIAYCSKPGGWVTELCNALNIKPNP